MSEVRIQNLLLSLLLMSIGLVTPAQITLCPPGCNPGRWSTEATDLSSDSSKAPYNSRNIQVYAPDHHKSVHVVKENWWVEAEGTRMSSSTEASEILYPAEVAWAPDSQSFFITQSVGYSAGYHTDIYRIMENKLVPVEVNRIVEREFDRRHKCFDRGTKEGNDPNIAGFKWLGGSDRLLIVAEVPPIGVCKDLEYFGGYEVSLNSQRIVQRFSPQQLADRWGEVLGERLKSNLGYLSREAKATMP
jgi:hypothetical protein